MIYEILYFTKFDGAKTYGLAILQIKKVLIDMFHKGPIKVNPKMVGLKFGSPENGIQACCGVFK